MSAPWHLNGRIRSRRYRATLVVGVNGVDRQTLRTDETGAYEEVTRWDAWPGCPAAPRHASRQHPRNAVSATNGGAL